MNFKKIAVFSIAIAAAAVAAAPVFAACPDPAPQFGTTVAALCPANQDTGEICAVRTTAAVASARFWGFNKGNFAVDSTTGNCGEPTCGSDNGLWRSDDSQADGSIAWLLDAGVPNTYVITGDWAGAGFRTNLIDGCPATEAGKTKSIMMAGITDSNGAFAIAWAGFRNVAGGSDYDFSAITAGNAFGDIVLRPVPRPFVVSSSRVNATDHTFTIRSLALADIQNGLYGDANVTAAEAAIGYKIYTRIVPRGSAVPAKDRSAWTAATATQPLGGANTPITVSCATNSDVYFAYSVVGNSNWEGAFVGTGRAGQCGPTIADPVDPKYKPVPRGTKNQLNPNN